MTMNALRFESKAVAVAMAFAVLGCQPQDEATPIPSWGPVMPIQVGAGESFWTVKDWIAPGETVERAVYCPSPAECNTLPITMDKVILGKAPRSGIGVLKLTVQGRERMVPVLSKGEVRHTFKWSASNEPKPSSSLGIVGDLTGWNPEPAKKVEGSEDTYMFDAILRPGNHPYQWVVDGEWMLDPAHDDRMSNGMGGWNSVVRVAAPEPPGLNAFSQNDKLYIQTDGPANLLVTVDDALVHHGAHDQAVTLPVVLSGFDADRHHVRAWAAHEGGISQDLLIPTEGNIPVKDPAMLTREDWHSATMYFLMVDRFVNGNPDNDEPVDDPAILPMANHFGGDLQGVAQKVEDGYFEGLGMNTVWISPVTQNAEGAWGYWQDSARTDVTSRFSGYHGYWPVSCSQVDRRFGSQGAMNLLTDRAHDHGMNVLLDYVGNHVHEDHPLMDVHPGWTTELYLPDGSLNTERWDEHRLTTWFDTFMPTLDLARPEVAEAMSDSAAWWAYHSGIDGFRHDATKHISEVFWRKLTTKLKAAQAATGTRLFQIGETYGSPDLIGGYLSSGMLDAQFDFNLYDKAVGAIAFDNGSWEDLVSTNKSSLAAYGAHHLMGNITGNQDRPRFTSLADGTLDTDEDMKFQGWTRDIQHGGDEGYAKMRLLMSYLMSVPGIPCVYYGDEIADVGGNDPDNRRMMRFDNLNEEEVRTKQWTAEWTKLRRNRMSLLFGQTTFNVVNEHMLHIQRTYLGEVTDVFLNRDGQAHELPETAPAATPLAGTLSREGRLPAFGAVAFHTSF
mgnify:CR=1 FL=1